MKGKLIKLTKPMKKYQTTLRKNDFELNQYKTYGLLKKRNTYKYLRIFIY